MPVLDQFEDINDTFRAHGQVVMPSDDSGSYIAKTNATESASCWPIVGGEASEKDDWKPSTCGFTISLHSLLGYNLLAPLTVLVQRDGSQMLAELEEIPLLYGIGDTIGQALTFLKEEVEALYQELNEDENFSQDYLEIKRFLNRVIGEA